MRKFIRSASFGLDGKSLTLRPSHSGDEAAIARLVELEEAPDLVGDTLVAELDGTIVAALSGVRSSPRRPPARSGGRARCAGSSPCAVSSSPPDRTPTAQTSDQ